MEQMRFTTRVLGAAAAERLTAASSGRRWVMWATIRSRTEAPIERVPVLVLMDGRPLCIARPHVERFDWRHVKPKEGGFDTWEEWTRALRRAGFRFKHLDEYKLFLVRLRWMPMPHLERNLEILARREGGALLRTISSDFGLSRERIQQIIRRMRALGAGGEA